MQVEFQSEIKTEDLFFYPNPLAHYAVFTQNPLFASETTQSPAGGAPAESKP